MRTCCTQSVLFRPHLVLIPTAPTLAKHQNPNLSSESLKDQQGPGAPSQRTGSEQGKTETQLVAFWTPTPAAASSGHRLGLVHLYSEERKSCAAAWAWWWQGAGQWFLGKAEARAKYRGIAEHSLTGPGRKREKLSTKTELTGKDMSPGDSKPRTAQGLTW